MNKDEESDTEGNKGADKKYYPRKNDAFFVKKRNLLR